MILKYRGIAYQPEHQSAIAQSQQTLQFLGQHYSATTQGQLMLQTWSDRLQFLGQHYRLPALPAAV